VSETQTKLGKVPLGPDEQRDAIHIAVAPVVAAETLEPGQRIGFVQAGNTERVGKSDKTIGIVDPFLQSAVWEGARFWMFLLPNTITSLRHNWTHPAFGDGATKDESRVWIEGFAAELNQTYSRLMDAAAHWQDGEADIAAKRTSWNDNYTYDNTEAYKDVDDAKWPIFWKHYEIVTGTKVRDHEATFFTCSC
jgi:hypothetical protein